jgi:hypothetical protein
MARGRALASGTGRAATRGGGPVIELCLLAEVHGQGAGLLSGPLPGWMQSDSEDADAPGGVLDHGQDAWAAACSPAAWPAARAETRAAGTGQLARR